MKTVTVSNYKLKQFTSSLDGEFIKALALYNQNIAPSVKTNSNELAFWLDNSDTYGNSKLFFLGFYCGEDLIGFSEMVYLPGCKTIMIDYIVTEPNYRKYNIFFEFIDHIKSFIINSRIEVLYAVAEIWVSETKELSSRGKALARLLKMAGFKVAKARYHQPQLGEQNTESRAQAILMVFLFGDQDEQISLRKETYLKIVREIYFEHYLPWYQPHMTSIDNYRADLEILFQDIQSTINKNCVVLNGHHELLEKGHALSAEPPKGRPMVAASLAFTLIAIISAALVFFGRYLGLSPEVMAAFYGMSLIVFIALLASIRESPTSILRLISNRFSRIFKFQFHWLEKIINGIFRTEK